VLRTHVDDEYAHAGERDPKILITTSRDPSSRLTQFAKELKLVFPNAQRINRGNQVSRCRAAGMHNSHWHECSRELSKCDMIGVAMDICECSAAVYDAVGQCLVIDGTLLSDGTATHLSY
jgi:hypothetical protein